MIDLDSNLRVLKIFHVPSEFKYGTADDAMFVFFLYWTHNFNMLLFLDSFALDTENM